MSAARVLRGAAVFMVAVTLVPVVYAVVLVGGLPTVVWVGLIGNGCVTAAFTWANWDVMRGRA